MVQRTLSRTDASGIATRVFVSGNSDSLFIIPQDADSSVTIVLGPNRGLRTTSQVNEQRSHLSLLNESDIEADTRALVTELCTTKPGPKGLLDEFQINFLIESIRGNYNLEAKMTEINSGDTKQKVRDVINNTTDDMDTVQRNNLKALESSLDST
jgi:hypothetical protein